MQENDNKGMVAGVVAVLVIVAAVVGFVLLSGNDEEVDTSADTTTSEQSEATADEAPAEANIVALAQDTAQLSTLVDAVVAADLVETLSAEDAQFTVFAPTNAAFNALPEGTLEDLLKPANKDQLTGILTYHVVEGAVTADQLSDGQKIKTVQGDELTVKIMNGKVMINGAEVVTPDVEASNGVVHIIDSVLLPS